MDKILHFLAGVAIVSVAELLGLSSRKMLALVIIAALGKEIYDILIVGKLAYIDSFFDAVATFWGGRLAIFIVDAEQKMK